MVGCGKGVVYLMSLGCPTDVGLQLGKACYSYRGECFYFFCFIPFIPVSLSSLSLPFISSTISSISSTISSISFLPFSGRRNKMTHKG